MTTKSRANKCVTHHAACDCREYRYEQMESALKVIRTWAGFAKTCQFKERWFDDIVAAADKALGK